MIFRLLHSVIYSVLVLTLTGIPQAALAVVSCQDTINTNTSIRYSDALVSFKSYNGKTYAIARSAATGGTSAAETFFDFTANITRAYALTGDSTGSLKNLLSLGQYGAATPVRITSTEIQQFILTQYGKYLGSSATAKSSYIDAWKEYGSGGFTAIDGSILPYTNWPSPVYTGQNPQAVVMGADGTWTSGLDGLRTAQIVQFDGVLDCATDFSQPQSGTGTTTTPPPTGSGDPDLAKPVCGQDVNGNGYAADPGEIANCLQTAQGLLCPISAVNCVESYSSPVCPAGSALDTSRDMCQAPAGVTCGAGYTYDASIDRCVQPVTCPDGGTFNAVTDQCEKLVLNECPTGYTYDSTLDACRMSANCSGTLNPAKDRCETPPAWKCPTGFTYNASSAKCEATPYCPTGTAYDAGRDRCEVSIGSCPTGYTYNLVFDKCTAPVSCSSGGSLNGTTDTCETTSSISCPAGTTYNAASGKCEAQPTCSSPGNYSKTYDLCLTPSTGTVCPAGYAYSSTYGTCISSPSCVGGTYSAVNDRCETPVSYSCSNAGYSYNSAMGRCEKTPVCSQGAYNATYNVCLQSHTPTCSAGYTYNAGTGRCELVPQCGQGAYNPVTNKCESGSSYTYPATPVVTGGVVFNKPIYTSSTGFLDYVYSSSGSGHTIIYGYTAASSFSGGIPVYVYPPSGNLAFVSSGYPLHSYVSPVNYGGMKKIYYSSTSARMLVINSQYFFNGYVAPSPGTYGGTTTYTCPSGGTLSGTTCIVNTLVQTSPTCPGGNFQDSGVSGDVCWTSYTPSCPGGMTYDSSIGYCTVAPTCTNGVLDGSRDVCYQSANAGCLSGYSVSGNICIASTSCGGGGSLNGSIDYCTYPVSYSCPSGYSYSATYGQCYQTANCGVGSLSGSLDICQQSYSLTCPSGYTLNGSTCQASPSCTTGGSYSASLDLCDGGSNVCSSPLVLDSGVGKCYQPASCSGGTLNVGTDKCEAAATVNCGSWTWDGSAEVCFSPPVCNLGVYDATANECRATITRNCGTYGWSSTQEKCIYEIVCPKDGSYSLSSTVAYSPTLDKCVSDTQHSCPAGTAYNGLPIGKCEAVPTCTGDGIYNPRFHTCYLGMNTCPLGIQYTCMNNSGTMQCSPNHCFTAGTSGTEETTTMDESMMQNDGQRDQDGNCLDQLFVFNGKASRCRPPGLTVGMINDCCQSDSVGSDDMGSNISMVANGVQTAYEIGQVAYYSYMVGTGAATVTPIVGTASVGIVTATGTTTVSGAVATGVSAAAAGGSTGAAAVGTAMQAYVGALLNPATIAVAVVVMVVMKVLMGNGCDQGDIQTGMQAAAKDCHYIGDYCEKKWPLVGCVQKAKGYCCFNTKMARIIHEQGRPQLQAFGTDGGWGTAVSPNCRGFTPDEFQSLDFSRIDLSEYFGDIQKDLDTKIQGAQTTIRNKVQQQFGKTTGAH
ncbi:conjugal transfer protein TraN [Geobacter sp. DSM 9736]|uniref:conjugal transfer protein TraN n=1 Tax=Geobacter sp. DSM 9736 TaxID=1277350 RepID=UPI000B4FE898|nr:conjugal transfer protein TraN [Geobacter sp. DSM 9736]SNB45429.1 Type-1V conjugative transfer system mating pair stabilisation [Geobacter sp. DSM 9736]